MDIYCLCLTPTTTTNAVALFSQQFMVLILFLLLLELVSIAFQTLGEEVSFTSLVMGVLSVIYYVSDTKTLLLPF